ncbi:hypothetical protein [Candidatus Enterococcus courvalinii]|uniref:hypothetical protein n=1 Tax=Candidatus Enterococcus courvalinii TaxID=2815329 RepID=UPI001F5D4387|nr:hypothetical protein [Enterococcus sp. MSG2901]
MNKVKMALLGTVTMTILSIFSLSGASVTQASEISKDSVTTSEEIQKIAVSPLYTEEENRAQNALNIIKEKYSNVESKINKAGEVILNDEDEKRVSQAIQEYLDLVGYNSLLRGVGKNWWNSTSFVSTVIDVGLIALGLWTTASSVSAVRTLLRNNRRNITRMVEKEIMKKIGLSVGSFVGAAIDVALTIASTSVGGVLAEGFDRVDGKNDNYIFA